MTIPPELVNWYEEDVLAWAENLTEELLAQTAARVAQETILNINENDQIDTGFMINTVYFRTQDSSTYGETAESGVRSWDPGKHGGQAGERLTEKAPEAEVPGDMVALVAVGANYAIYQEMSQSFLYAALVTVAQSWDLQIERRRTFPGGF